MIIGLDSHMGLNKWWVYDYFPEALPLDKKRYPPAADIKGDLNRYGFTRCEVIEVEHIEAKMTAQTAREAGLFSRGFTSQLTILSDTEYENGLLRLQKGIEAANSAGEDLLLTTDLRLYAVIGWKL